MKKVFEYEDLTDEAKETLKGMVEYCINHGIGMGMDEGLDINNNKKEFRAQLEAFC